MLFYYFYLTFYIGTLSYIIARNIYLFYKDKYNPYVFKKGENELPFIIKFICILGMNIGGYFFVNSEKSLVIILNIFLWYSFFLVMSTVILNYLSYKKNKDQKIILHTAIMSATIIIISLIMWRYVGR
ncbi:MAG: hypothetical protein CVU84_03945 [Firmicutes bacterium HGW-Firmicutes-1]|jgi:hypothetical protein|nr:MAG: hypothetical protein CVU84_03945 [Firmicutes bacterium HGW-Firmicutes-1]